MAIKREYECYLDFTELSAITGSIGSHIAAKLQAFGSDERTLTDELCNMLLIWSQSLRRSYSRRAGKLHLKLIKTTQIEEAASGADLELIVRMPWGLKKALLQAKVLDPDDNPRKIRLRCDSPKGWEKLRQQLKALDKNSPGLGFLTVYVPGGELLTTPSEFSTWEQRIVRSTKGTTSSESGILFFPVQELLGKSMKWRRRKKLEYRGSGEFFPAGISLTTLLTDLLACRRGQWNAGKTKSASDNNENSPYPAKISLDFDFSDNDSGLIEEYLRGLRPDLPESKPETENGRG